LETEEDEDDLLADAARNCNIQWSWLVNLV
jgi:hypothetical protein